MGRKSKYEPTPNTGPGVCCLTCREVGAASGLARHLAYCGRPAPTPATSFCHMQISVRLSAEQLMKLPPAQLRAVMWGLGEVLAAQGQN